jgi:hypothetical protein
VTDFLRGCYWEGSLDGGAKKRRFLGRASWFRLSFDVSVDEPHGDGALLVHRDCLEVQSHSVYVFRRNIDKTVKVSKQSCGFLQRDRVTLLDPLFEENVHLIVDSLK